MHKVPVNSRMVDMLPFPLSTVTVLVGRGPRPHQVLGGVDFLQYSPKIIFLRFEDEIL